MKNIKLNVPVYNRIKYNTDMNPWRMQTGTKCVEMEGFYFNSAYDQSAFQQLLFSDSLFL